VLNTLSTKKIARVKTKIKFIHNLNSTEMSQMSTELKDFYESSRHWKVKMLKWVKVEDNNKHKITVKTLERPRPRT